MNSDVTIEYGETDQDCIDTHLFLCVVGGPTLLAPIDPNDSIAGIMEVRDSGIFLIARKEGYIISSLGMVLVPWWYNTKQKFFVNRWFSAYPEFHHTGVGLMLEAEAAAIGHSAGIPVIITSHARRRKRAVVGEPYLMRDHLAVPVQPMEATNGLRSNHH